MNGLSSIAKAVVGKRVIPPLPPGRSAFCPAETDEPEIDIRDGRSGLSYFIEYEGGSLSQRRISIRSLYIEHDLITHFVAYCHERNQIRTFRTDRIAEAIDPVSGEVFSRETLCHALLNEGIPVAERRLAAMLRILVFMARCDGNTHYLEWDAIDSSFVRLSRCLTSDERSIDAILNDARRLAPDGIDFIKSLRGLTKTRLPARMHLELRRAIAQVIEADGIQHPEEVRWALDASDFISAMPTSG